MRAILVWRVLIAGICGLLVTAVCLMSTLENIVYIKTIAPQGTARRVRELDKDVQNFKAQNGAFPQTLAQAYNFANQQKYAHSKPREQWTPVAPDWAPMDAWHRPIIYRVQGNTYTLASLGRDGKPGGVGLDCDLTGVTPNSAQAAIPLVEVLLDPLARGLEIVALCCGAFTAATIFQAIGKDDLRRKNIFSTLSTIAVTLIAACVVAMIVTILHIPSGH